MSPLRIVRDLALARATILRRMPLDEVKVPPEVAARLGEIFGRSITPEEAVRQILKDVCRRGDEALREYTLNIEGVPLDDFLVPSEEFAWAKEMVPEEVVQALEFAAHRIRLFHEREFRRSWVEWEGGSLTGQVARALERVGLYAPGGRAPYPSSLLMAAIPAQVAGVKEVLVATPPGPDGRANPAILAAAQVAQVDAVYKLGGAQAIAALAYGTQTIPKVDKILGPGNIFVVLAKRLVFGAVDIDQLPGPTETMLLADDSASAELVAADLLAQAEHDPLASAILLTTSESLALAVQKEVERQLEGLAKAEIAAASLRDRGGIVIVPDLAQAVELANEYAPEHLCLLTREPWKLVGKVRNAGGIFIGEACPEALGDYTVGPSHIMPTGGTARFSSPLNVNDFLKITNLFATDEEALENLGPAAIALAEAEGLTAHAQAIKRRLARRSKG